ncbi:preprotein translocase subunit SecE [Antrihabitans sp. YC2-6]|uniref:preprotein translocase subunit SecE n=1 Tax=Antrihabitans sp. YC2-6 TaxID=2799498 RepID=UPI0018F7AD33|nr:preprotein translocase subunit SecE [Antrihabitans sp. YC2-6]MBJ8347937.1 preprotein translocase subunit SecE [Antrihabitans sp. YC2-6]
MSDERKLRDGGDTEETTSDAEPTAADATEQTEGSESRPSGKRSNRRTRATSTATASAAATTRGTRGSGRTAVADRQKPDNIFKRLRKFLREVIAELRKVIWPNRKQMITYTSVVLVFVVFMVAFISGLDVAFIKGVSWLFG